MAAVADTRFDAVLGTARGRAGLAHATPAERAVEQAEAMLAHPRPEDLDALANLAGAIPRGTDGAAEVVDGVCALAREQVCAERNPMVVALARLTSMEAAAGMMAHYVETNYRALDLEPLRAAFATAEPAAALAAAAQSLHRDVTSSVHAGLLDALDRDQRLQPLLARAPEVVCRAVREADVFRCKAIAAELYDAALRQPVDSPDDLKALSLHLPKELARRRSAWMA